MDIYLRTCYRSFTSDEFFKIFNNTDLNAISFHRALNCAELNGRVYVKLFTTNITTLNFIIQQQPNDIDRNCILYQINSNINNIFTTQITNYFSVYQHSVYYTYQDILNMLSDQYHINTLLNEWTNNIIQNDTD
jgi:hypothetical protein